MSYEVLEERVRNMEVWQQKQNGHILRVEEKLDGFKNWIMGLLATAILQLAITIAAVLIKS